MAKSSTKNSASPPSFEQSLAQLQMIVQQLEDGELPMEEALAAYEQGVAHLRRCYQLLQAAEQKVQLLTGVDEAGNALVQDFAADS